MKIKQSYTCSFCNEEFIESINCKQHEMNCNKFVKEIEGTVNVDYKIGFPIISVGDYDLIEFAQMLHGKKIKIQIIEPVKLKIIKNT